MAGQFKLLRRRPACPDPDKPAVFTGGYRHEVEIGGELYTIIAKLDDYTGTRWSSSRDTDGFPEN